jgi:glucose-1-phosphate thymidylyltransferase
LAAGYSTRLYPLTENFPKPLLEVKGKSILDWLTDDIVSIGPIDKFIVVSNHKYAEHFNKWARNKSFDIDVIDDGTVTNETRLGAVMDMQFAIDKLQLTGDLLVIAGDNLLDFSLAGFINYTLKKRTSCVMRFYEEDMEKLKKGGVVCIDGNDMITDMCEKPDVPKSKWMVPPFYFIIENDVKLIKKAIVEGCGVDAPGSFIAWLCHYSVVHAMEMMGKRYDIGNLISYKKVQQEYNGLT